MVELKISRLFYFRFVLPTTPSPTSTYFFSIHQSQTHPPLYHILHNIIIKPKYLHNQYIAHHNPTTVINTNFITIVTAHFILLPSILIHLPPLPTTTPTTDATTTTTTALSYHICQYPSILYYQIFTWSLLSSNPPHPHNHLT